MANFRALPTAYQQWRCELHLELDKKSSAIVNKNGGIMTGLIGESFYFVVTDPSDCIKIANESLDKDIFYDFGKPWLGDGLLTGSAKVWKCHRKSLNPAFSQQVLNSFIDIFNLQSKQLVNDLEAKAKKKAPFNHLHFLEITTLETIYQTAIGINPEKYNIKYQNAFIDNVKEMFNILITRVETIWLQNDSIYKWSSLKKRQEHSVKIMKVVVNEIMNAKSVAVETNESKSDNKYKTFMDLLLEYSADGSLSSKEVRDEVNTILVAGHETSATTLAFILILLGSHSNVQEKAYQELKEIFGNSCRDVDKMDLTKLLYLEAVILETIRIYPIAPAIVRRITQNVKLDNYTLTAGSSCVFLIYGIHYHPIWGADADQFRPERWLEPSAPPRNGFAGFGLGKRNCIGKRYAMMFMKTILVHILLRYKISADVTKLKVKLHTLLKPQSGCLISIDKRST